MSYRQRIVSPLIIRAASGGGGGASFDYYIGPSGSDSNDGLTPSTPWALTALNDSSKRLLYAGQTVGLLDGTYNVVTLMGNPPNSWTDNHIGIAAGSSGAPTIVRAVNPPTDSGGTPVWSVILDGQRALYPADDQAAVIGPASGTADYVTIQGIEIIGANYQCIHAHTGQQGITIRDCYLHDQQYTTDDVPTPSENACNIMLHAVSDALISNCLFGDSGAPSDQNRHEYILVYGVTGGNSTNVVIEYCTITDVSNVSNGIYFKTASGFNKNVTVRYCDIDRSGSANSTDGFGILVTASNVTTDTVDIIGNIIHGGIDRAPIFFIGSGHAGIVNCTYNTLLGDWSDDGGACLCQGTSDPDSIDFSYNILSRTASGPFGDVHFRTIASTTADYNSYDSSPSPSIQVASGTGAGTYTSLASWQSASSLDANSQAITDPLFAGTGNFANQYKLQSGSSCKTLGPGSIEIGAWGASGRDAYDVGFDYRRCVA